MDVGYVFWGMGTKLLVVVFEFVFKVKAMANVDACISSVILFLIIKIPFLWILEFEGQSSEGQFCQHGDGIRTFDTRNSN